FLIAVVWVGIQAWPLPFAPLENLSFQSAALYNRSVAVVAPQSPPSAASISVDAGVTREAWLKSAAYFCFYLLLLLLIDSRSRLRILCYVIVLSGLFQAVYGSLMTLSGLEYLFGIKKVTYLGNATGTFVNRNHFAGYLEMALAAGLGLMMVDNKRERELSGRSQRSKWTLALSLLLSGKAVLRLMLIIMVTGLILSGSRMGNAAFFNSLLLTGMIAAGTSSSFRRPGFYGLLVSIFIIDVYLLGSLVGLERVVKRIEQTSLASESRDEVVQYGISMLKEFGLTGTGAGTFEFIFPVYIGQNRVSGYDHAHNDYLEIMSDLGVIGFAVLGGMVLISLWQALKALRHRRSSFVRGMGFAGFMGTVSLLIHSSVDFNLQIPANALLFIAMLAMPAIALSTYKTNEMAQ
ncbi:MAG: O-antigen ligase family protein, partial [Gammaproteobacteria bacterium]